MRAPYIAEYSLGTVAAGLLIHPPDSRVQRPLKDGEQASLADGPEELIDSIRLPAMLIEGDEKSCL